jgi:hypothetical protein
MFLFQERMALRDTIGLKTPLPVLQTGLLDALRTMAIIRDAMVLPLIITLLL